VLNAQFPYLYESIGGLCDSRKHKEYAIAELVVGSIAMFMFKFSSRNQFDNYRKERVFRKNYQRTFKLRMPSGDAIEDLMRMLDTDEMEMLKTIIVKELIRRKVFHKFRFLSKKFFIAIDGTGTSSYQTDYCGECTSKTSKNGNTNYFHYVLEAKLVTHNDMAISIATEWVSNKAGEDYNKQDCELKAFIRLAAKIKKQYPQVPLVILADGLYPNQTFFKVCQENHWDFIVTFKEGNLPSVHQEIGLLPASAKFQNNRLTAGKGFMKKQDYTWVNNIDYKGRTLSVINCEETKTGIDGKGQEYRKFTHITNLNIDNKNFHLVSDAGRLRWRIENSFDYLKNHGYNLGHKFSRASYHAYKNYYQCMMIAHIINQFVEKSSDFINLLKRNPKCTILFLWERLIGHFSEVKINQTKFDEYVLKRCQIRLA
jgi:hypothetical protein